MWKSTHKLAGKLWVAGGLVIIFSCFIFNEQTALTVFFIITAIITFIPVGYSYLQFKKNPETV
ncbi:SdpI family protein [Aequorivita antarctica]|uniref:SdpI family protein n=1 Tax=Aequorivita antarctica TaxID=153266 RepID=UPI0021D142F9|nr:SdpI family protein [Aequorivita antarctica]